MVGLFYNHKGGVGKTTLCSHVAFRAMEKKIQLTVLDADRQRNTMQYLTEHSWTGDSTVELGTVTLTNDKNEVDFTSGKVIIDAPPAFEVLKSFDLNIDKIFIPVDGRFSGSGAITIVEEVKNVVGDKPELWIVPNKVFNKSKLSMIEKREIRNLGLNMFDFDIPQHEIVRKSEMLGIPTWKIPYGIRSLTVQNLKMFADWALKQL